MIIKTPKRDPRYAGQSLAQRGANHARHLDNYVSDKGKIEPVYTNLAGQSHEERVAELEAWHTLNPRITAPMEHRIFSFEKGDREPTPAVIERIIDIFREERGLGDALFAAYPHRDGHDDRHPLHLHLEYMRIKSDGKSVPTKHDSNVHFRASRRIEKELGLTVNSGKDNKHNGRDKRIQRERSAERQGIAPDLWHVDPDRVSAAIAQSRNISELRRNLQERGITMRTRERSGEVFAWSLRNIDGPKEWTSGSDLTASNDFGWKKVADKLAENRAKAPGAKLSTIEPNRRWSAPRRRLRIDTNSKTPPLSKKPQPVDVGAAMDDGMEVLGELFAIASHTDKKIPGFTGIATSRAQAVDAARRAADQNRRAAVKRAAQTQRQRR